MERWNEVTELQAHEEDLEVAHSCAHLDGLKGNVRDEGQMGVVTRRTEKKIKQRERKSKENDSML